jgi:hypothetical protein
MIEERVKPLLDPTLWQGKIFSNGWTAAGGGTADVTDKSTGASLGRTGVANAADIAAAAKRAKAAFPAWAATAPAARAAILRKAADLMEAAHDEIANFDVRETGGIRPKGDFEVHVAVGELREAATLAEGAEQRKVIEKTDEMESVAVRVPIGVVARRKSAGSSVKPQAARSSASRSNSAATRRSLCSMMPTSNSQHRPAHSARSFSKARSAWRRAVIWCTKKSPMPTSSC